MGVFQINIYNVGNIVKVKSKKTNKEHYGIVLGMDTSKLETEYKIRLPKDLIKVSESDILGLNTDINILRWFKKMEFTQDTNINNNVIYSYKAKSGINYINELILQ